MNRKETEQTGPASLILMVDDEEQILLTYSAILKSEGYTHTAGISDPRQVIPFLEKNDTALILLDLSMPSISGEMLIPRIQETSPQSEIIVVTAKDEVQTAVSCMKMGISDYLVKPVEKNRLLGSIRRSLEIISLKEENLNLRDYLLSEELKNPDAFRQIVTCSNKMFLIFKYIEAISHSPFPVLILGETGTGKELVARAIHRASPRSKSFVTVNVAGLDDTLFSDTLFGHKKGAFTGAGDRREGLISQAKSGTLFLDEIGDMSERNQVKLLRLIQEKEYYPLGSDVPLTTDARIIVATNLDLEESVRKGNFRKDLFFRLSAHRIRIPPLKERPEDIRCLTDHFLQVAGREMGKKPPTPPAQLFTILRNYAFPGNIRELESLIYDAVSRHRSGVLSLEVFRKLVDTSRLQVEESAPEEKQQSIFDYFDDFPTLKEMENFLIREALRKSDGNQRITASLLGLSRQALNKRLSRRRKKSEEKK